MSILGMRRRGKPFEQFLHCFLRAAGLSTLFRRLLLIRTVVEPAHFPESLRNFRHVFDGLEPLAQREGKGVPQLRAPISLPCGECPELVRYLIGPHVFPPGASADAGYHPRRAGGLQPASWQSASEWGRRE